MRDIDAETALAKTRLAGDGAAPSIAMEIIDLVRVLGTGLNRRIEGVEQDAEKRHQEIEQRFQRYEASQEKQADRVVAAVERLARLEAVPDRLMRIEQDMEGLGAAMVDQAKTVESLFGVVNDRLDTMETTATVERATRAGEARAWGSIRKIASWIAEHSWPIVKALGFVALAGAYVYDQVTSSPQPSHGRDWPLRTEFTP